MLLTPQFNQLPELPGTTYVQPSRPVPVGTWDYTDNAALQAAFDLGQSDGAEFYATHKAQTSRHPRMPGA